MSPSIEQFRTPFSQLDRDHPKFLVSARNKFVTDVKKDCLDSYKSLAHGFNMDSLLDGIDKLVEEAELRSRETDTASFVSVLQLIVVLILSVF